VSLIVFCPIPYDAVIVTLFPIGDSLLYIYNSIFKSIMSDGNLSVGLSPMLSSIMWSLSDTIEAFSVLDLSNKI
jgi:hypothetical protein